jgi:hypothetical protein
VATGDWRTAAGGGTANGRSIPGVGGSP